MALLGQSINPALFVQDYSGFAKAGAIQAQGMQNLGQQIQDVAKDYATNKKEESKLSAVKKAGIADIQAAIQLSKSSGLGLESTLEPLLAAATDPNSSLIEQATAAQQASQSIASNMNAKFKIEELNMQRQAASRAGAMDAAKLQAIADEQKRSEAIANVVGPQLFTATVSQLPLDVSKSLIEASKNLTPLQQYQIATSPDILSLVPKLSEGWRITTPQETANYGMAGQINTKTNEFKPLPESKTDWRITTPEEVKTYGSVGQINIKTNEFKPIPLPSGTQVTVSPEGNVVFAQGAGVGAPTKTEVALAAQGKQKIEGLVQFNDLAANLIPQLEQQGTGIVAGTARAIGSYVPSSETQALQDKLSTVKNYLSRDYVNTLRAASPTGSAGGSITEKEWPRFENQYGVVDVSRSPVQNINNLQKIGFYQFNAVHGTPSERAQLLKEGKITPEQNAQVEQMYLDMRNRLKIPATGIKDVAGSELKVSMLKSNLSPEILREAEAMGLQLK
jgi:hypothetical protein